MLQIYPEEALDKLEFDKIKQLLMAKCQMEDAVKMVENIRLHTKISYLSNALLQTKEYKLSLSSDADQFPNSFSLQIKKELQLLKIDNAMLSIQQMDTIRKLVLNMNQILKWFKKYYELYPTLIQIVQDVEYTPFIAKSITKIIDDQPIVKDNASNELYQIRIELNSKRQEQRRKFDSILRRHAKKGQLSDIGESFINGRRTLAVLAEHKRIIKGILHGESESGKTAFIEPEETIGINNEVFALERAEEREITAILKDVTMQLRPYYKDIETYYEKCVLFDFIAAKAKLAMELNADMPQITPHPSVKIINGYHPILFLHNKRQNKKTVPVNVGIDRKNRILMISGPNAGGKTVTMKTVGLLQMMLQAGLLVPTDPRSEMGIYKQLFIHIGDTQSIENELSTYSAHLKDMKYFVDFANGKTLFFIDELGSGSDPNLGGAFAEAIVEALSSKYAQGIITTHYLNLKVMAGKVSGIFNGAMAFDEMNLEPLYQLELGKPGSSYTFAIAQRARLHPTIINRAKELTDRGHFKLDKMLHRTEQQSVELSRQEKNLDKLLTENQALKDKYERLIDKEKLNQHYATLKLQNKIKQNELDYLKDMERKFKQIIADWKKADNKQEVIKSAEKILFKKKQIAQNKSIAKKANKQYKATGRQPKVGDLIRNTINHQVGTLLEIDGKNSKVKISKMIFTVSLENWVTVRKRTPQAKQSKKGN